MSKKTIKLIITIHDEVKMQSQLHKILLQGTQDQIAVVWEELYSVEEEFYAKQLPFGSFDIYGTDAEGDNPEEIEIQTYDCAWSDAPIAVKAYEDFFVGIGMEKLGTWEITHEPLEYV